MQTNTRQQKRCTSVCTHERTNYLKCLRVDVRDGLFGDHVDDTNILDGNTNKSDVRAHKMCSHPWCPCVHNFSGTQTHTYYSPHFHNYSDCVCVLVRERERLHTKLITTAEPVLNGTWNQRKTVLWPRENIAERKQFFNYEYCTLLRIVWNLSCFSLFHDNIYYTTIFIKLSRNWAVIFSLFSINYTVQIILKKMYHRLVRNEQKVLLHVLQYHSDLRIVGTTN